ncbi:MAG: glycosyltransferase [Anaerolineae bacterium]|nr:glycosyltransferase [Anaerolineae bacterium]
MSYPTVAIIIPSLNSLIIDQIVRMILAQDKAEFIEEVVIVGKDDFGLLAKQKTPIVKYIDTGTAVPPATARNIGIQATASDLLIFLDSDCIPQDKWLSEHLTAHQTGHSVVGGGVIPDGVNYWALVYNLTMFHEYFSTAEPGSRPFLPTLNLSVERDVVQSVGLLDETLPRSQDLDWTTRMNKVGFQPYFWPTAVIMHQHNRLTGKAVWQDCARSGRYARVARLQHQDTLKTPVILRSRHLLLILSPLIASAITLKIIKKRPFILRKHWQTLPAIFMSKLAWCWGASRRY